MSAAAFDPRDCSVVYSIFNDGWDFVIGNYKNQHRQRLSALDRAQALPRYLNYLAHSISSLRREHGDDVDVTVRLVQIAEEGISTAELSHLLGARVPGPPLRIELLPWATVQPFVEEALQVPQELYRSPNRLHEFVLLDTLRSAARRYVAIVDPDVTFLRRNALWQIGEALAARPERWIGAFLERSGDKPWQGKVIRTRERMHSVLLVAAVEPLRQFPFPPFLRVSTLEERLATLSDAATRSYYESCRVLDTLSLMTDWLRQDGVDRILDLSTIVPGYREGKMLTLVCELMLHAKFLEDSALQAIRETIDSAPWAAGNPRLKSIRERLGSGLILAR